MTNHKHIQQTVVNTRARRDLDATASLAPVSSNRHRTTASDFVIWQNESPPVLMNVNRKDCTHHGIGHGTKQAFEFRRSGGCHFSAKTNTDCIQEPMLVSLANIDWYCLTFHA